MTPVKRLEIVVDTAHTPELLQAVKSAGARGYTLVRDALGAGDRGERTGDHLTNVFKNSMIVIACEPELVPGILDSIRPLLERHGGVCLVSDAEWLRH